MAQTGYTPIQLYYSSTASSTPTTGNLTNGELAINITDGKLFYKDNLGAIQVIGTKGGVGSSTNTQVLYNSGGLVVGSANLTFDGTTLTAGGLAGPFNGTVGATTANTGAFTTLSASSTVSGTGFSTYLASPPAIGGTAPAAGTFTTVKAIAAATQDAVNLQGRAGGSSSYVATITPTTLTGNRTVTLPNADINFATGLPIANGGTGATSASAAFNALSPITSTGDLIIGNGTNSATRLAIGATSGYVLTTNGVTASWQPSTGGVTSFQTDLSGLTPSTSSTGAITLSGTLGAASGGTNQSTYATGDILYASASNTLSKLPIGSTTGYVLTVSAGGLPVWSPAAGAGVTTISFGSTGLTPSSATGGAVSVAGTLATSNGGTGLSGASPFTSGGVLYASSVSALTTSAVLAANALVVGGGAGSAPLTRSNITSDNSFLQLGASTPLRFADSDSSNYVSFQAPATITSNVAWTLPATDGTIGQVLSTNGAGVLSWATASGGGGTPGAPVNSIQFNSASAFGGSANLTWDGTNVQLGGAGALRFADTDNSNYVAFKSPGTVATNVTWTLPATDGTANQVLSTNGSGTLSWVTASGGASGPILESQIVISQNYTLTSNTNGFSVGPVSVATGYAVTVGTGQVWVVSVY